MEKPTKLCLILKFDDGEKNQYSVIDLEGMESISIEQVPIIVESPILGSNKKKIKQLRYVITVDYGQGLELDEKNIGDISD